MTCCSRPSRRSHAFEADGFPDRVEDEFRERIIRSNHRRSLPRPPRPPARSGRAGPFVPGSFVLRDRPGAASRARVLRRIFVERYEWIAARAATPVEPFESGAVGYAPRSVRARRDGPARKEAACAGRDPRPEHLNVDAGFVCSLHTVTVGFVGNVPARLRVPTTAAVWRLTR